MIIYKLYENKVSDIKKPINIKINISHKEDIISKYKLKLEGNKKLYCINNVEIIYDKNELYFYKIYDKKIMKNKNLLIIYRDIIKIPEFNFNKADYEEIYVEYKNTINNIIISCKEYNTYLTLSFELDDTYYSYFLKNINIL